ncbi:hypothetical protein A9Q84_11730 [Halobacteriovorax marinus]|uniref:HTH tetR-type domain-containing protein n=1 Tax=Halobacteriovorax marinus TaxID=97084 RepID=A0A1Y5FDF8_9BACT|nr:hypothetical protein A9Q84_11730 [Halobacteriovorax marinus]
MNTKEDVYHKICHAVLKMEISKGHLKWTLSDISREADVTRSLIYYYFGKEKKTILEEAFRYVTEVLFNTGNSERLGLVNRMKFVLERINSMPFIFVLFFLKKREDSELGRIVRKAEEELFVILKRDFPELTEKEVKQLYILELGSIAFNLDQNDVSDVFNYYESKQKTISDS